MFGAIAWRVWLSVVTAASEERRVGSPLLIFCGSVIYVALLVIFVFTCFVPCAAQQSCGAITVPHNYPCDVTQQLGYFFFTHAFPYAARVLMRRDCPCGTIALAAE